MQTIDSRHILANALRGDESISISKLKEIASHIKKKRPEVYVDISSVSKTLGDYGAMFIRRGNRIERGSARWFQRDYINTFFNDELPSEDLEAILQAIRETTGRDPGKAF